MTTANYSNRLEDKNLLESKFNISEIGNNDYCIYLDNNLFIQGYERIVYGDHGPYIELKQEQIKFQLFNKYSKKIFNINYKNNIKYYYEWLYPSGYPDIKVYYQLKMVKDLPNAPKRSDGKKSDFNRLEGYADYKIGFFYIDPYQILGK